jgi:hypothetical protein
MDRRGRQLNRTDAMHEADRARKNAELADELARLRRRSWELAAMRGAPAAEVELSYGGMLLAEREGRFWAAQALEFAALASAKQPS